MSLATRRVPRLVETAPSLQQSSADIRERLAELEQGRRQAEADLAGLERDRPAILKSGTDDDAERHDAAIAKARRAIERANLQRPDIETELQAAEQREAAEALAQKQAEARAKVQAVIAKIPTEYDQPRATIQAFTAEWAEACREANAAGIESPESLLRYRPAIVEHAHEAEERYTTYLDEDGQESSNPYPPGNYLQGENGELLFDGTPSSYFDRQHSRRGSPVPRRRQVTRTRTVKKPYRVIRAASVHDSLHEAVCLPPARIDFDAEGSA